MSGLTEAVAAVVRLVGGCEAVAGIPRPCGSCTSCRTRAALADLESVVEAGRAEDRARIAAEVLHEAADAALDHFGTWGGAGWAAWLRDRAALAPTAAPEETHGERSARLRTAEIPI